MPNKKILVTGGAGYIGSHANALLNTLGFQTIVLDNLVYGHKESLHYAPLPFSYTSPFTKSPTALSQNLEFTTNCHFERSEKSSIESKKDISPFSKAQYDKNLDSINSKIQDSTLNFLTQLEQNFNGGGGKYTGFYSL